MEFLTEFEASRLLHLSIAQVRRLRRAGLLPYLRLGFGRGAIRYEREALIAAVRAMSGNAAGHAGAKRKPQQ